ncbi:flagellar protein FlaG [Shewanella sp. 0m-4]
MDVSFASSTNPTAVKLDTNNSTAATGSEPLLSSALKSKAEGAISGISSTEEAKEQTLALHDVANELTDMMSLMRKGLAFKVDEHSGQNIVSVMDVDSGDVIRQIPNEEALELAQKLAEVAGFLLKTEA